MIISRYLPEPAPLTPHSPGSARDDSPTRLASSRLGDSGRRPFAAARRFTIVDRLKPYTVAHQLIHRLKPYEATDVGLMFRNATWGTILYWAQLLDSVEIEERRWDNPNAVIPYFLDEEPAHEMA